MGRTKRHRLRNRANATEKPIIVSSELAELVVWMRRHRWSGPGPLRPALFPDTGRGLLSRRPLQPGATLVSIPLSLLVSSATALRSELGAALRAARPAISAQLAVSLWLALERRRGADSGWRPYLASLPSAYTTPAYCEPRELSAELLPGALLSAARGQRRLLLRQLERARQLLRQTSIPCTAGWEISEEEFRHAWFTVNTRAVFLDPSHAPGLFSEDNLALAPFLDLFNHSPTANMSSRVVGDHYELVTEDRFSAGEQVFINYGPHDNLRLLLDYGFVVPGNSQDAVPVPAEWVPLPAAVRDDSPSGDLTVGRSGVSWGLAVRLYLAGLTAAERAAGRAADVWRLAPEELTAPSAVRRTLAALLVRLVRHLESCLAAQRAMTAPSDALRVCSALLREWLLVLQGHVWERGRRPDADGVVRSVYGTRLGDVVTVSATRENGEECYMVEKAAVKP
ncbi:SET domain-containing protein 4-like [Amphibalanus amphitrite]|uniref:SET domain-containing protein 4-like n=1 Tax=Amphibalanus amphitrite TaxID=1232801 RepID=UPI001C918059|nr:SET domain-containing protein 4-like [Amphibalanus amphitrite]